MRTLQYCDCFADVFTAEDGRNFLILGDGIYPTANHIVTGFPGGALSFAQRCFNDDVSTSRAAVEWGFGRLTSAFPHLKDWNKQRLLGRNHAIGKKMFVGVFLMNCANCMYSSITPHAYGCPPPSLRKYLYGF